ncbi:hypothetical protein F3Y22_tig00117056pilonHSYRG00505 [Hibiscus syriacus]|uniref:Uncharacterized protein n=1 Tax=Hibiscus syriacus TaxID=106335 RepID=A0A6A2W8B5_HIBSY|nr:hypothetical protein F3Y22_tig00117056pilonHSYRG00505 [Hibiscus syriacus]
MVSASLESPVSGHRFSSVVPAKVTSGNKDFELTNMDLAMKLHYIKGVISSIRSGSRFVRSDLKGPMFECLEHYSTVAGRIRRSETGRPFIKCNDGGVRIVEARCDQTVDEWLATARDNDHSLDHMLAYDQVLGPDLGFSPLAFVQFTWFNVGAYRKPFSLKKVDPVGDRWLTSNDSKMNQFGSKDHYDLLNNNLVRGYEMAAQPVNGMTLSTIEADFCVSKVEIAELAKLIADNMVSENGLIEGFLSGDEEKSDFIVYGDNLTFVNLEGTCLIFPSNERDGGNGKIVTMTLPMDQIEKLKNILEKDWNIAN